MRRLVATIVAVAVITAPAIASADDLALESLPTESARLDSGPGELLVPSIARRFALPVGTRILLPPAWERLDLELKRLQEMELRLTAENRSLRESAASWQPGWKLLLGALVVGLAGGAYAYHRLD